MASCAILQFIAVPGTTSTDRACQNTTVCDAGFETAAAPTRASNRSCKPCPNSTFAAVAGTERCQLHITCRPGVEYETSAANATHDRECATVQDCSPGQEESAGLTATSNRECRTCSTGSYSTSTNAKVGTAATTRSKHPVCLETWGDSLHLLFFRHGCKYQHAHLPVIPSTPCVLHCQPAADM